MLRTFEKILQDLQTAKNIMIKPYVFFEKTSVTVDAMSVFRYYVLLSLILSILTPIINILGFPSDVIHASTNAQMGAYKYAPLIEQLIGGSRYLWTGVLTLIFMVLKLPAFMLFYHVFAKLLGGKGDYLASLKVAVYPATPAMLFGWVPYSDFIFGLWVGFLIVPGLHYLHKISWGKAIAFTTFLMGLQILYVILSGGGWLIEPG